MRVGDTVRRATGPWTPAVHALLRHLEAAGFAGAPRVRGIDAQGREILTYLAGTTIPATLDGYRADAVLVDTARLLRAYHDATAGFVPPPGAAWRPLAGAPPPGDVICHNDIAPFNTVVVAGRPAAFIDWDFAAPGPRAWDVAYALWRFAPLYAGAEHGPPAERARRLALFCTAYGPLDCPDLIALIARRQTASYASIRAWAAAGIPAFAAMWRTGHATAILADRAYLYEHAATLAAALTR